MRAKNIRLKDAVDQYLERLRGEQKAEHTIRTASYALKRLLTWLESERMPNLYAHLFDLPILEKYLFRPGGLREGVRNSTFNQQRAVLNSFFIYCVQRKWMDENPIETVKRAPREERSAKLLLSNTELLQLLEGANPRDRALMAVGMNTGLRVGDMCDLQIGDVNLTNGLLAAQIHKTRKFDQKPITADLEGELRRWLEWYSYLTQIPVAELPNDWLLLPAGRWNGRDFKLFKISPRSKITHPERMIHRALARIGIEGEREGLHLLRRSSARYYFETLLENDEARDRALLVVRDFLNHSSVMMTELYIQLDHERTIRNKTLRGQAFLTKDLATEAQDSVLSPSATIAHLGDQVG